MSAEDVMIDQMPPAWIDNGILHIRASALGSHPHSLRATLEGFEQRSPSKQTEAAWARGNELEQVVLARLEAEGYRIISTQREVRLQVSETCIIVGHIDAEVENPASWGAGQTDNLRTLEVKSMDAQSFGKFVKFGLEDFPRHLWQDTAYLHALERQPLLHVGIEKNPEAEDGQLRIAKRLLTAKDLFTLDDIAARVEEIRSYPTVSASDCRDPYCRHWQFHERPDPIEITGARGDLFARILALREEAACIYAAKKELEGEVQTFLERGKRYLWEEHKITWPGEGEVREIDTDRLYFDLCNAGWRLEDYVIRKPRVHVPRITKPQEAE